MSARPGAEAIPLTVLGGYLGAGKTTVINSLLRRAGGRRIGILVNDFGEVNVDAQILRASSDGVVELAGGCVCCDLSLGMGPALVQLLSLDPPPDQVLVEVSGVGEPVAVVAWAHSPGFRPDGVIVVVPLDRIRALAGDRWVADLAVRQLQQADLLVCTRGDLLDAAEREAVAAWLRHQSPAPQVDAPHGEVPLEVMFGIELAGAFEADGGSSPSGGGTRTSAGTRARSAEGGSSPRTSRGCRAGTGPDDDGARGTTAARGLPGVSGHRHGVAASSFVRASTWKSDEAVDAAELAERLAALAGLLRAKGFVRSTRGRSQAPPAEDQVVLVQAVGAQVDCTPWPPDAAAPIELALTVLTTPDVDDAAIAAALSGWRRADPR